jgi:ABC-type transport system involved in multi-copper enzyme maturation permease subunit
MATRVKDLVADEPAPQSPRWLDRVDRWCEEFGDTLNPILIKETRQALKSRQFVVTFSVLLFSALAWTIVGSLSMMPQIYTSPSAPRMLIGYYVVLALPMLLVVPLAAYRSLEGEIDDGTLELLSITTLSPWQIVLGKLASAMLQMLLYFVALFPCVAYAYTLRGVDLPTTLLIMAALVVTAILLTIIALFFAPLSRTRTGRISTLLSVMLILLLAEWGLAVVVIGLILYGNPLSTEMMFFAVTASLLIAISLGHLLLTATAAQLTPESENRSTHVRIGLLVFTAVLIGLAALSTRTLGPDAIGAIAWFAMALAVLWTLCGSMLAAESPVITPRIRRELPSSFLARCAWTWLTPGPVTGLVFASVHVMVATAAVVYFLDVVAAQPGNFIWPGLNNVIERLAVGFAAYLVGFMVAVRIVIGIVRVKNNPRVEIGIAALIAVAVLTSLVPYSIGLHLNDYRSYPYSLWQITNWAWTLGEISRGRALDGTVLCIVVAVSFGFFATLLTAPGLVFPRRIATPARVKKELDVLRHS